MAQLQYLIAVHSRIFYFLLLHYLATSSATPLLLLEWSTPSGATALMFRGTFVQNTISLFTPGLFRTNKVLNLLAIYAINCGILNL